MHWYKRLVPRTLVSFMFPICTVTPRVRGWRTSLRRRCVAQQQMVSAPPLKGGSGAVRPAQRAEVDSDSCHSFASLFEHCESHISRFHRVNVTLHENLFCSSSFCRTACSTHNPPACGTGVHDATRAIRLGRNSGNSSNSRGETEAGRHRFCVPLSTSARSGVRRCAVHEFARLQRTLLKLHEETWRHSAGKGNRAGVCCCGGLSFMS